MASRFHHSCGCYECGEDFYPCEEHKGNVRVEMLQGTEKRIVDPVTGGEKGQKGCQMGALDPKALWEVGNVAGFGGVKYERYNFAKGYKWSLSYDALQRHLMAFWSGESIDPESKLPHLAHAAWHCLTLLTFSLRGKGTDDRFPCDKPDTIVCCDCGMPFKNGEAYYGAGDGRGQRFQCAECWKLKAGS